MNEYFKLLVEHLLNWPVAILAICLLLKSPIANLLNEVTALVARSNRLSIRHKDTSLEAMAEGTSQTRRAAAKTSDFEIGAGSAISTNISAELKDVEAERNAIIDYGKGVSSVQIREDSIRSELQRLEFDFNSQETVGVLIRQLAALQCVGFFERIYRIIYGSQLGAIDFLNTTAPVNASFVEVCFFDTAKSSESEFYSNFSFEQWLQFLEDSLLISNNEGNLAITQSGRDFLVWTVSAGLTHTKPH